ncbi:benzyl alcohol O-benzoyltransferase-like [Aristolochia californica]|uniref:benzyl alcohol O-benzoyltransferase-like n=1 Tax=Aristolochia californica TaxID=171875 RepID=UPI0035D82C78
MASTLKFSVRRQEPVLVAPAKPTPHEFKLLSDIDDQQSLRFQIPVIQFYPYNPSMDRRDPCRVIRDSLARVLVYYYPFAGRLRESPDRKLVVECTGEGVLYIEADADVKLQELSQRLQPPFPYLDELLYDIPGSGGILHCPLLLIQVTRLSCGAFILALRLNHTMADASGFVQFLKAAGEIARGAETPSLLPVWERHLLSASTALHVRFSHREYECFPAGSTFVNLVTSRNEMTHRSFFIGPADISNLRTHLPTSLRHASTFDILTATFWRCRTAALHLVPDEEVRVLCIANARRKFNPPLPDGYYGNVFAFPAAVSTASELCGHSLGYAVELVRKAKFSVTEEYIRSVANLMALAGKPQFQPAAITYLVSDVRLAGFQELDFGWGGPVYGGPAAGDVGTVPGVSSFYIPFRNYEGVKGILIPICLPRQAMEEFIVELEKATRGVGERVVEDKDGLSFSFIKPAI